MALGVLNNYSANHKTILNLLNLVHGRTNSGLAWHLRVWYTRARRLFRSATGPIPTTLDRHDCFATCRAKAREVNHSPVPCLMVNIVRAGSVHDIETCTRLRTPTGASSLFSFSQKLHSSALPSPLSLAPELVRGWVEQADATGDGSECTKFLLRAI